MLPTWDQALDAIGDEDEPLHVARFGAPVRRPGRARRIQGRQPVHRLPHQVPDQARRRLPPGRHRRPGRARRPARRRAAVRAVLADLRELAPLRHPAQERPARPAAGRCKGKAHRREYLGYAGRRVLVSRKWSGKTLADHRADRKTWLTGDARPSGNRPQPATPGNRSSPATPTTCPTANGSCTSSPTASNGKPPSNRPAAEPPRPIFRQLAGRHEHRTAARCPPMTRSTVSRY